MTKQDEMPKEILEALIKARNYIIDPPLQSYEKYLVVCAHLDAAIQAAEERK